MHNHSWTAKEILTMIGEIIKTVVEIIVLWFKQLILNIKLWFLRQKLPKTVEKTCRELDQLATVYQNIKEEQRGEPLQETIIAVDFDGTLCEDKWPKIGDMNEELILSLIWRQRHGASVILWTCREGEKLDEAVKACEAKGLYFEAINENLEHTVVYFGGNRPRKVFATEYIDDRNSKTYWKLPYHPVATKIIIK